MKQYMVICIFVLKKRVFVATAYLVPFNQSEDEFLSKNASDYMLCIKKKKYQTSHRHHKW